MWGVLVEVAPGSARVAGGRGGRFALGSVASRSRGRCEDFGDFGVSDAATVAWRYTRRGGPRLSVQGEPLVVLTRGP